MIGSFVRRLAFVGAALILCLGFIPFIKPAPAEAAVNPSYLILDSTFENTNSMSSSSVNQLLNNYAGSCISSDNGFTYPDPEGFSGSSYQFGSNVSAGKAIYDIAQNYHVSPQVILTTLQKEQSVVTGSAGCHKSTPDYTHPQNSPCGTAKTPCTSACPYSGGCVPITMGYYCPDYCYANIEGFSKQISGGTWVLRWAEERAYGTLTGYAGYDSGDETFTYTGPMTPGSFKRSSTDSTHVYDGTWTTSDGHSVKITNGATASLYNYTPFLSGNTNFSNIFTSWFGSPVSICYNSSNPAGDPGRQFMAFRYNNTTKDYLTFARMNGTNSACAEVSLWKYGYTSWYSYHKETAMAATNPTDGTFITADTNGNGKDSLIYITYGHVGVHKFNTDLKQFHVYDTSTNLSGVGPREGTFVAGDFLGRGYDQILYVMYNNASGHVEIHMFSKDLTSVRGTYDVATNLTSVNRNSGVFVAGDFLHKGYDQLAYVKFVRGTKPVEVHIFSRDLKKALGTYDIATGLYHATAAKGTFVAGKFNGKNDQLLYFKYDGGSNKAEVHVFNSSLTNARGTYDVATNLTGFTTPPL